MKYVHHWRFNQIQIGGTTSEVINILASLKCCRKLHYKAVKRIV